MDKPLFSFIIPVYNAEEYISRCIESILAAAMDGISFEVLLVDDGSTDKTYSIGQQFADKYENISIFYQPNSGVSAARNKGLDEAKGEFLCFVDADDNVSRDYMEVIADRIRQANPDMIQIGYRRIYALGQETVVSPRYDFLYQDLNAYFERERFTHAVWTYVIRRSLLSDAGVQFDKTLRFSEDQDVLNKCFIHARSIQTITKVLYDYNDVPTSAVNRRVEKERALAQLQVVYNILVFCQTGGGIKRFHREIIDQLIDDYFYYAQFSEDATVMGIVNDYKGFYKSHLTGIDIGNNRIKMRISLPKLMGVLFIPYSKIRKKLRFHNIHV